MKKRPVIFFFMITLFWTASAAGAEYTIERLTDNQYYDGNARINANGIVVWEAKVNGATHDIMMYDRHVDTRQAGELLFQEQRMSKPVLDLLVFF